MMRSWFVGCLLLAVSTFPAVGQVLPKAPAPSQKMLAIDVGKEAPEVKFLVYVLQGLVNRTQPRLYVTDDQFEGGQNEALQHPVKDWGREALQKEGIEFREVSSVVELLQIFEGAFQGSLLYDKEVWSNPGRAHVINGLTTECALEDLLPVTEELNKLYKLQVRGGAERRWPDAADYHFYAGSKNPTLENVNTRVMLHKHPWSFYGTDYAVANRLMTVWFDRKTFDTERGQRRLARVLERTKPNTAVLGAWQSSWPASAAGSPLEGVTEPELLGFLSAHGKFLVPVSSPGNFSVHSGLKAGELKQKKAETRALDPSEVYVTLILSGGENVSAFNRVWPGTWNQPERGKLPIGWTFNPALFDLSPATLKHAFEAATPNDYFVAAGPGDWIVDEEKQTSALLQIGQIRFPGDPAPRTDSPNIWGGVMDDQTSMHYLTKLPVPEGQITGLEPGKGDDAASSGTMKSRSSGRGKAVFYNLTSVADALRTDDDLTSLAARIASAAGAETHPQFVSVGINGLETGPARLAELAGKLPPECVVVRPDEFVHLYEEAAKGEKQK